MDLRGWHSGDGDETVVRSNVVSEGRGRAWGQRRKEKREWEKVGAQVEEGGKVKA